MWSGSEVGRVHAIDASAQKVMAATTVADARVARVVLAEYVRGADMADHQADAHPGPLMGPHRSLHHHQGDQRQIRG